jgi:hypothetical protein
MAFGPPGYQVADPHQLLKEAVESYWQNPGGVTDDLPPLNLGVTPVRMGATNGLSNGRTP